MTGHPAAEWDARLRASGLRSTTQRRAVLEALADLRHATVDELAAHVQQTMPDVSLSTVYRTLEVLGEVGLVTHAHLHHGSPTYHVVDSEPHLHLVCTACGSVQSAPWEIAEELTGAARARRGFHVDLAHLVLHGRCADCVAADEAAAGRAAPAVGSSAGAEALPLP